MHCGGIQLSNGLERVDWASDRVQLIVCDHCGFADCASGGYIRASRLGDYLVWGPPAVDAADDFERTHYAVHHAFRRLGPILIPVIDWERWRHERPILPPAGTFPISTRDDIVRAWLAELRGVHYLETLDQLRAYLAERLMASDSLDPERAREVVDRLLAWSAAAPDEPHTGRMTQRGDTAAVVETLYFDGPRVDDWPALARLPEGYTFALGREFVIAPALVPWPREAAA